MKTITKTDMIVLGIFVICEVPLASLRHQCHHTGYGPSALRHLVLHGVVRIH